MKYFKFVLLIIMLTTTHLQAQWNYVVDVVGGDSTALVKPMKTKGGLAKGDTISWLHNGDTVFVAEADSGFVDNSLVTITMDKQKYFVDRKDLMFGDNPSERADFVNSDSKARKSHTRLGHLYLGDTTLYWLFLGLLLAATIFAFFGSVICIPLILAAPAIEVVGLCFLGKDMLWWIEGSWTGVLRLLLFALAVTLQIVSFYYFTQRRKSMIKGNVDVSSPLASALFGVGALLVMTLVCNFLHVKQSYAWIIKVVAVLIISVPDFIKSLRNNGGALGFFAGLMFTFFVQLSVVGMLASLILLVMSVFKTIVALVTVPVLVVIVILLVMLLGVDSGSGGSSSSSGGSSYEREREAAEKRKAEAESRRAEEARWENLKRSWKRQRGEQ